MSEDYGLWWSTDDPETRARRLSALVTSLDNDQEARKRRILRDLRRYEGRDLADLTPTAYYASVALNGVDDEYRVQLPRALVSTAVAKIAGKQKPKALFAVTDGDWGTKRRAKKMERAVEAIMQQRQGLHLDGYSVLLDCFRDCGYADCGVVKYWPDFQSKKVVIERVLPWEFLVDPKECRAGAPLNYFHRYGYDRFKLVSRFPKYAKEIMAAPAVNDVRSAGSIDASTDRRGRMVQVDEGWRVALSEDEPGVHTIAVGGVDLTEGESWEWTFPPFEMFTWEPWRIGIYGTSLVEIAGTLTDQVNQQFERWAMAEQLGSNMVIFAQEDSVRDEDIKSNIPATVVYVKKSATAMPTIQAPTTMGPTSVAWLDRTMRMAFDVPGISQADAQAEREPGLQSGEAQRIVANIKSERFSPQWQQYERVAAVGSARQILRCLQELAADGEGDVVVSAYKGTQAQEFRWKDFSLELPEEAIQIAAVSGLVNTPADRVDVAERLFGMGILSPAGVRRVIQAKDLDSELESEDAQARWIEKQIERWLDPVTKNQQRKFEYVAPIKWMNLAEAIVQVGRALFQADVDGVPDWNRQRFIRFLEDCDRIMEKIDAQKAQTQAAAGGNTAALQAIGGAAGGPPAPPGAPPGGPQPPPPQAPPGPQQAAA